MTAAKHESAPDTGFIDLGVMGSAMAATLLASRPLMVWNRTGASSERLAVAGAAVAESVAAVFERCSVIFLMLPTRRPPMTSCVSMAALRSRTD